MSGEESKQKKKRGGCLGFLLRIVLGIAGLIAVLYLLRGMIIFTYSASLTAMSLRMQ